MSPPDQRNIDRFMSGYADGSDEYPRVLAVSNLTDGYAIELEVTEGLDGFRGHFPGNPVLAGVVQLHWTAAFAAQLLEVDGIPVEIKQLKFKKVVQPPATISLKLQQVSESRVNFEFFSTEFSHSSGQLFFEKNPS